MNGSRVSGRAYFTTASYLSLLFDFTGSILLVPSTTSAGQSALVSIFGMVGGTVSVAMAIAPLGRSSDIYWDTAHG